MGLTRLLFAGLLFFGLSHAGGYAYGEMRGRPMTSYLLDVAEIEFNCLDWAEVAKAVKGGPLSAEEWESLIQEFSWFHGLELNQVMLYCTITPDHPGVPFSTILIGYVAANGVGYTLGLDQSYSIEGSPGWGTLVGRTTQVLWLPEAHYGDTITLVYGSDYVVIPTKALTDP